MRRNIHELYGSALDLARHGELDAAQASLAELLDLDSTHASGWGLLGALHMRRGHPREALPAYQRAVSLGDQDARTHLGFGLALLEFERNAEAASSFERATATDPRLVRAHIGLSRALHALGRGAEALQSADRALALDGANGEAWRRRGLALYQLERLSDALEAFRSLPTTGPPIERSDALADIGLVFEGLRQYDKALATYDEAVATAPGAWMAPYRRGFLHLLQGRFAEGWSDYEARWRRRHAPLDAIGQMIPAFRERLTLAPTREDFSGQHVLVVGEQGIGDMVMFASVLPDLAAVAARVTCVVENRLLTLFSVSFPGIEVVAGRGPALVDLSRIDRVVAIGSLPHAFRRTADAFPGRPYLQALPTTAEAWRARLGPADGRRRIGLSWRGGAGLTRQAARSMPLELLRPLLERPRQQIVSLQYGDVEDEIAEVNRSLSQPIVSFPAREIDDFDQLAGLLGALDAVVTVQTAVGHLAGALGRRGFVMVPQRAEWRYGAEGASMPWYDSLRLFRQTEEGDWPGVIARIAAALDDPAGQGV